jgi:CheY-like chemotaxis protein
MSARAEDRFREGLEEVRKDLQMLLDCDLTFGEPTITWTDGDAPDPELPLEFEIEVAGDGGDGRIRVRVGRAPGIAMGGLQAMLDESALRARVASGEFEPEDADALEKVGGQIAGSLRNGLASHAGEGPFRVRPGEVRLPGDAGPGLVGEAFLRADVCAELVGHAEGRLVFTFDAGAAAAALGAAPPAEATEPPAEPRPPATGEPAVPGENPPASLLLLYDTRASGWETARVIRSSTGWPVTIQRRDGTARRRLLEGGIAVVVIDTGERKEGGLTHCRRLVRLIGNAELPVFLCAPAWRREEVQRAIKAGVSGILVKPLDPDRVRAALGEFAALTSS